MNKKITLFTFVAVVMAILVGCGAVKNTSETKDKKSPEKMTPQKVTSSYLKSFIDPSEIVNLRFHFEKEFVLTLVDEDDNGIRKVDDEGNSVLLNYNTVRFPVDKLGKFVDFEMSFNKDATFQITWEEESYDQDLGASSLKAMYDDSLRIVIQPAGLVKGKPFVVYQKAKYLLPADYKNYFLVVGETKKGNGKVVSGVKTPGGTEGN